MRDVSLILRYINHGGKKLTLNYISNEYKLWKTVVHLV